MFFDTKNSLIMIVYKLIGVSLFFSLVFSVKAQDTHPDSLLNEATLQACLQYALNHQPVIRQSYLDEQITERQINSRLADWYPQVNFSGNYQHYFQLPSNVFGTDSTGKRQIIQTGIRNTSVLGLSATQNIFNRDVLLASRTAADVRQQAKQNTISNKIDIAVAVSKAFYDILTTQQQVRLLDDAIIRLSRSLQDAFNQYKGGLVDKIDYKRATIALNNSKAQKKSYEESLTGKYSYLKNLMNYPQEGDLDLQYDSLQLEMDARLDTMQRVQYANRIEYRQLETERSLQKANLKYNKWSFLPSVSAFGNYNLVYLNQQLKGLYGYAFPNSYAGISVSVPIFQGFKRVQQIKAAELQLQRIDWDFALLENNISTEYIQAMASYKASLYNYDILKENVDIATEVYNTVQLQYKAGVKTYLDVIISESDLRSAQVNYTNALYNLLYSKLDVQQAAGSIQF